MPAMGPRTFQGIKAEFVKMLQVIGFKPKKGIFIPCFGFNGDNLVATSNKVR
jgi:translation elongation factor EF-1alpha